MFDVADELLDRLRLEQIRIHSASTGVDRTHSFIEGRGLANPAIISGIGGIYLRMRRKSRQRASGSPFSRSLMTATDAAPASISDTALSSVMPPMATVGSPALRAAAAASDTTRSPTAS